MSELEPQTQKKSGLATLGLLILLVIAGAMAFLWSSTKSKLGDTVKTNQELQAQINSLEGMLSDYTGEVSDDLRRDLKNMLSTYDQLKKQDASKASVIEEQQAEIQRLLDKVESNKWTASELAKMKRENETLRNIMKGYVRTIDSLNTLNLQLNSDLDVTRQELSSTSSERDQYRQEAETSAAKVKEGSKLSAYSISTVALRSKLNDMTAETNKAKNTIQIKSAFTVGANPITPKGRKAVYMQVIKPDGSTFQRSSANVISTDAGSVPFSDKKDIDYNGDAVSMAVYYDLRGEEAQKGTYQVRIFVDGQLIGKDSFTLK